MQNVLLARAIETNDKKNGLMSQTNLNIFRHNRTMVRAKYDCITSLLMEQLNYTHLGQQKQQNAKRCGSILLYNVVKLAHIRDDFYSNLVDWSSGNYVAVGVGSEVFIFNANSNDKIIKQYILSTHLNDFVVSVAWTKDGAKLAVGLNNGSTHILDAQENKLVRSMRGHSRRVNAIAWNDSIISTGSEDRSILHHDVRAPDDFSQKLLAHKRGVCGLKWSFDGKQLASGGDDNKLILWSSSSKSCLASFSNHRAAVKAIAWSQHCHDIVASGGGTEDKTIKIWNSKTLECIKSQDTGSQVCNIAFSKNTAEFVSTHGYPTNQISIWSLPGVIQTGSIYSHARKVSYLSMSPNGENIVSGAGDETLKFWNIFPIGKLPTCGTILDVVHVR